MIREKLKTKNKNQRKKYAIYILLLLSNIALFIGLINHYSNAGISISLKNFDNIAAVIATISILGFISLKLPKIKDLGDHPIYGIVYILIICVIGVMTSYFDDNINITAVFGPYLEMFKILCGVLIFILLAMHLKSFKEIISGKHSRRNQLICLIIFTVIGLFASYAHIDVNRTPANIRCLIVMIGGLFGGPIVGIPVGIISGAYRYSLAGPTAIPCAVSTVLSGVIGSLIFIWNDKKFPKTLEALILMFLFTGFEMLMVVMLTPPEISFPYIESIYPVMLFASVTGMLLFSITFMETKENMNPQPNYTEEKIHEFEERFEKHAQTNEELRDEIRMLKDEIRELKKEK